MRKLCFLVFCVLALITVPLLAHGAAQWTDCRGDVPFLGADLRIVRGDLTCWEFDDDTDSGLFSIDGETALICLDPNIASEGAATAQVMIRYCHSGVKPTSNPEYRCFAILDAPLTGATGSPDSQNACTRVATGAYMIDVTTSAGGDDAIVSVQGE